MAEKGCPKRSSVSVVVAAAMSSSSHEPAAAMWDLHANYISAWVPMISNVLSINNTSSSFQHQHQHHHLNPNSNSVSCEEEDASMASSALTVESSFPAGILDTTTSSNELIGDQHISVDNHLWSHMLLSSSGDLHENQLRRDHVRANLRDSISSKRMFEPAACDYLKKFDSNNNCWELMDDRDDRNYFCNNVRGTKQLSGNLVVSDWSIAPPQDPSTFTNSMSSAKTHQFNNTKINEAHEPRFPIRSLFNSSVHDGINNTDSIAAAPNHPSSCRSARNIADVISFGTTQFSKPVIGVEASRPLFEPTNGGSVKPQGIRNSSQSTQANKGRGSGTRNEGKRRRSEESSSESGMQKQKHEQESSISVSTSSKVQVPKVKLGDRIATLQQIVSPFGKTDTASVLMEAIAYIKFLQEQVQLLVSNPYLKTNSFKDPWDRKDVNKYLDLRSRGLCLIPVSCAPHVCGENNTGSDYWTPTYRGMFYR